MSNENYIFNFIKGAFPEQAKNYVDSAVDQFKNIDKLFNIKIGIINLKNNPYLKLPTYATKDSACMDIYSQDDFKLFPGETIKVPTGISLNIPKRWKVNIYSRSGQGFNNSVTLVNCVGIIDSDYTGEIVIGLRNDHASEVYFVKKGQAIAQFEATPVYTIDLGVQTTVKATERGSNGFGSTNSVE